MQFTELASHGRRKQELALFQSLFATYYQPLLAYTCKVVNDIQSAEDIVQDVFMSLWINRDTLDFTEPLGSYLYKAVYKRSLTYLNSRRAIHEKDATARMHEEIVQYDQQDSLLLKETFEEIRHFVETLPPQCKKAFKLSRFSHLKNREIAEVMQISEKTVEAHIGKALKELRAYLVRIGLLAGK
ncbi:MAG: RNA polymerase sigma-70 factor [Tannerellaceae bacterium]|jgi:RNA polymerase sigma-70 factor (ECF subfamily)|nr:RNA polymerase sigma-70 factor [Tannerellaceae bacterium]